MILWTKSLSSRYVSFNWEKDIYINNNNLGNSNSSYHVLHTYSMTNTSQTLHTLSPFFHGHCKLDNYAQFAGRETRSGCFVNLSDIIMVENKFWFKFNVRGHALSGLFSNPGKTESGHVAENPECPKWECETTVNSEEEREIFVLFPTRAHFVA